MVTVEHKQKRIVLVFLFLFVILVTSYRLFSLWKSSFPDFNVFYYSSLDLLHGINPYQDMRLFTYFNYPISTLPIFFIFTFFSYGFASKIFLSINLLSIFAILFLTLKMVNKFSLFSFLLFSSAALFFFPISFTLGMGQVNLMALLLLLFGIYLDEKYDYFPGILVASAILIKPILIYFLLFFLVKKQWKIFFVSIFSLILFLLTTIRVFGFEYYTYYIHRVIPHVMDFHGREVYYNQGLLGFVSRLTVNLILRRILSFAGSIFFLILVFFARYKKVSYTNLLSIFFITLVLMDPLSWQHHFVFLIFPFIEMYFSILKRKEAKILLVFLTTSLILVATNIVNTNGFASFPQSLMQSHVFYGTMILLFVTIYVGLSRSFLQSKKNIIILFSLFTLTTLANYFLFIACRGNICLR